MSGLVSVVLPTFDRAEMLAESARSVLRQTHRDLELLVVDDGSTDGTPGVVEGLADRRVRLLRHAQNLGGGAARNTGIDAARGAFVAFIDSDDVWLEDKLARQLAWLATHGDEQTMSYTQVLHDAGRSRRVIPARGIRPGEDVGEYLFVNGGFMQTSTFLMPAALARRVGFDGELRRHQDYDFCLRLAADGGRFAYLAEALTVFRGGRAPLRVSLSPDPAPSLAWVRKRGGLLTPRARAAFLARKVAPLISGRGRPLGALRMTVMGAIRGRLGAVETLRSVGRVLLTPARRSALRNTFSRRTSTRDRVE